MLFLFIMTPMILTESFFLKNVLYQRIAFLFVFRG